MEERLQEEEDRVDAYLNPRTREVLISEGRDLLIREHSDEIWERQTRRIDLSPPRLLIRPSTDSDIEGPAPNAATTPSSSINLQGLHSFVRNRVHRG